MAWKKEHTSSISIQAPELEPVIDSRRRGRFEINVKRSSDQEVCNKGVSVLCWGVGAPRKPGLHCRGGAPAVPGGLSSCFKVLFPVGESRRHHSARSGTLSTLLSFLGLIVLPPNGRLVTLKA